jgi:hypothetical protein
MRFSDGTRVIETWDGRDLSRRFEYTRPAKLVGVEIDPEHKLSLEHNVLDDAIDEADSGPSLRAGARAGFWLQTAAQVVGL